LLFGAPDLGAENGVRIRATELSGGAPFTVLFAATLPEGIRSAARVEWDFGGGRVSHDPRGYHTFVEPGLYTVRLTVRFSDGSERTAAVQVLAHYGG
jgi:PKD repeat protein